MEGVVKVNQHNLELINTIKFLKLIKMENQKNCCQNLFMEF